jgi:hypothetical protein
MHESNRLATKEDDPVRLAKSKLVVDEFFAWCKSQEDRALDESPMAAGVGHALN